MLRLALDIRPRIDYIVPISFTEGPFARVLSKVERERFPEMQRYTAYPGGSGHRPAGLTAGLPGAGCTGAGEGSPVWIR